MLVEIAESGKKISEAINTARMETIPRVVKIYSVEQWLHTAGTAINVCIFSEF